MAPRPIAAGRTMGRIPARFHHRIFGALTYQALICMYPSAPRANDEHGEEFLLIFFEPVGGRPIFLPGWPGAAPPGVFLREALWRLSSRRSRFSFRFPAYVLLYAWDTTHTTARCPALRTVLFEERILLLCAWRTLERWTAIYWRGY